MELIVELIKLIIHLLDKDKNQPASAEDRARWEAWQRQLQARQAGQPTVPLPPPLPVGATTPPVPRRKVKKAKPPARASRLAPPPLPLEEGPSRSVPLLQRSVGVTPPSRLSKALRAGPLRRQFILTEILRPPVGLRD